MSSNTFRTSYRVTWADTDAAQVVHYSNYFKLFERAEEEFYRQLGFSFTDARIKGFWFPRVEAFCQYKRPARFNDLLEIELTIEDLKEKSVKYGFKIFNKETAVLLSAGYIVVVAANRKTETAARIPKWIAEKLEQFRR